MQGRCHQIVKGLLGKFYQVPRKWARGVARRSVREWGLLVAWPPANYDSSVNEGGICQTLALVVSPVEALVWL